MHGENIANEIALMRFAKDLSDHGKKEASFRYDFKFVNPATTKIQVKDQFCEILNQTVVAPASTGLLNSLPSRAVGPVAVQLGGDHFSRSKARFRVAIPFRRRKISLTEA